MKNVLMAATIFLLIHFLSGCKAADLSTPTGIVQTEVSNTPVQQDIEPTLEQEKAETSVTAVENEEPTVTIEPTPTATPVVVVDVDSACVNCHNDTERLKELAVEPEKVELSSGEG